MDRCFHTDGGLPTGMKLQLLQISKGGGGGRHVLFSLFKQSEENNDRRDAW